MWFKEGAKLIGGSSSLLRNIKMTVEEKGNSDHDDDDDGKTKEKGRRGSRKEKFLVREF